MRKFTIFFRIFITIFIFVPLTAQNPYNLNDETWLTIEGTIVSIDKSSFELDYGKAIVTVEMDGWNWYAKMHPLLSGYKVVVHGVVDDDLFESTSIEASSVYVKELNTHFYASPSDEEDVHRPGIIMSYNENDLLITGIVTSKLGREFTIKTGSQKITVETSKMVYNPLDDKGFQKIDIGDKVQVIGDMNYDFVEMKELIAESIITLKEDESKNK